MDEKKVYKLEKQIDGEWYVWGEYESADKAAKAAFELGRNAFCVENIRVVEVVDGSEL